MNSILPTVTSAALGNQTATQKVNSTQQAQQAVTAAVTSGAVVNHVNANKSDADRTASYGEKRSADATFAKTQTERNVDKKKEESKRTAASVNVTA